MAFLTKLLKCVNVPTHVHNNYLTEAQVVNIVNNTIAKKNTYIGLPNYAKAFTMEGPGPDPKINPIWKINVPGYLYYNTRHALADRDSFMGLASTTSSLLNFDNFKVATDAMILYSMAISDTSSGFIMMPIVPGTSTYFRMAYQESRSLASLYFLPMLGLPDTISARQYVTKVYDEDGNIICGTATLYNTGSSIAYMFQSVKSKIFAGDWKDNFPSLSL